MVIPVFQDIHYKTGLHTGKYVKFLYADSLIISLFYSTLFSDSTILIFFSLKCITIFTNMENPKVMIPL